MSEKVTPRQRRAVELLLTSPDVKSVADTLGVSRKTIYKWLKQPAFKALLAEAETEALTRLSRALVCLGDKAAETLEAAMNATDATVGQKVRAADIVLGRLLQLRELVDLEARVEALENQVAGR